MHKNTECKHITYLQRDHKVYARSKGYWQPKMVYSSEMAICLHISMVWLLLKHRTLKNGFEGQHYFNDVFSNIIIKEAYGYF